MNRYTYEKGGTAVLDGVGHFSGTRFAGRQSVRWGRIGQRRGGRAINEEDVGLRKCPLASAICFEWWGASVVWVFGGIKVGQFRYFATTYFRYLCIFPESLALF